MSLIDPIFLLAMALSAVLCGAWIELRRRRRGNDSRERARKAREALDTVSSWPPEATRVLTICEREAFRRLSHALPDHFVLAQVPLARFIRVPTRHSYAEWLARVGYTCADLLVCDANSKVMAVVEVRSLHESERSRRRHERMAEVLRKAGLTVLVWQQERLPTEAQIRTHFESLLGLEVRPLAVATAPAHGHLNNPLPLPDISEVPALDDIPLAARLAQADPVSSSYIDQLGYPTTIPGALGAPVVVKGGAMADTAPTPGAARLAMVPLQGDPR